MDEGYISEDPFFNGYIYIIRTLLNKNQVIEANTELDVILNMKLLNIEVKVVTFQQKDIVSLNV